MVVEFGSFGGWREADGAKPSPEFGCSRIVNSGVYYHSGFSPAGEGVIVRKATAKTAAPDRPQFGGFDERGLPAGGLWLRLRDAAGVFGVGLEAVRRWRVEPSFPPELEFESGGRLWLNVVGLIYWRLDRIRERRGCSAAEAVELLRPAFKGLPIDSAGRLKGWFAGEAAPVGYGDSGE